MKNLVLAFIAVLCSLTSYCNVTENNNVTESTNSLSRTENVVINNLNSKIKLENKNSFLVKEESKLFECTIEKVITNCDEDGNCVSTHYSSTSTNSCQEARRDVNRMIAEDGWMFT